MRWLALACFVALAATPLVVDFLARDDAYMAPKWAWIEIFTALGVAAVLARAIAGRPAMVPLNFSFLIAVLFCAWHWVTVLWAPSRSMAVDAAARMTWLTLALWLGLQIVKGRRWLIRMAWCLIALGMITAVWTLVEDVVHAWFPRYQWLTPNLADWRGFLSAGLGNTNHIGDLLALAMIPALIFYGEARKKSALWLCGISLIMLPAALIAVFSAGSSLGLVVASIVMLVLILQNAGPRWFARRWLRWAVLVGCWILLVGFFTTNHPLNPHRPGILVEGFGSNRWQAGGPTRLAIWAETLEMIRKHPALGVGAGNFTYVFPEMDSALIWGRPDLMVYQGRWTNAAHNIFMQAWAELGIVGCALLIALIAVMYFVLLHDLDRARRPGLLIRTTLAGLLTAWVVQGQVNFVLQTPVGALCFFGMLLAILVERAGRGDPRLPPLRFETDWLAIRIDWRTMRRPTAVGVAALLPNRVAVSIGVLLIICALAFAPSALAPVRAQREYRLGTIASTPQEAEEHFKRGLEIDPNAQDLRSHYSSWLLDQGRPAESLDEIKIVRQRLNSFELFSREARAYGMLGRNDKANAAMEKLKERFWSARVGEN
ncbi:O-antigen ligase family protein [bacterium]|nr:O-antigen ligase family protein [bacterium]